MGILQEKAMIATLSISRFGRERKDPVVTEAVAHTYNADTKSAGRYTKRLLPKTYTERIDQAAANARRTHRQLTAAWGDGGERILSLDLYEEYRRKINDCKAEFTAAVNAFITDYPQAVTEARTVLGSMFNPKDYPDASELPAKFAMDSQLTPIPTRDDFRVNLAEDEKRDLQQQLEKQLEQRQRRAALDLWNRLFDATGHMAERLADPDAIFRDSLVENMDRLTEIIPSMNITGDSGLTDICGEIQTKLLAHDADILRKDPAIRKAVAREAREINHRISTRILEGSNPGQGPGDDPGAVFKKAA